MWTVLLALDRRRDFARDSSPSIPRTARKAPLPCEMTTFPCRWKSSRWLLDWLSAVCSPVEGTYSVKDPHRFSMRGGWWSYGVYRSSSRMVSIPPVALSTRSRTHIECRLGRGIFFLSWRETGVQQEAIYYNAGTAAGSVSSCIEAICRLNIRAISSQNPASLTLSVAVSPHKL